MARPDPITMTTAHLLDESLIVYRDGGRRHKAIRIELERRLAELDRLRAIEAAAREVAANVEDDIDARLRYVVVQPSREEWSAFKAALAAKDML
jgi:hypothetical protein